MNIGSPFARAIPAASIVLLSWTRRAQTQAVQSFPLNVYKSVLDGQWQGIRYASDGNVYSAAPHIRRIRGGVLQIQPEDRPDHDARRRSHHHLR